MKTLKLRKELYAQSAIDCAIDAYRGIAMITKSTNGSYEVCSFSECEFDEEQTVLEFENYLIDLMASEK